MGYYYKYIVTISERQTLKIIPPTKIIDIIEKKLPASVL
jgi:hypothetical protein